MIKKTGVVRIECDYCGAILQADLSQAGQVIKCACGVDHAVPFPEETIECPYCFEKIDAEAVNCFHCGGDFGNFEGYGRSNKMRNQFSKRKVKDDKESSKVVGCLLGCGLFAVLIVGFSMLIKYFSPDKGSSSAPGAPYNSSWDSSVNAVEDWVRDSLKDPDSFEAIEWSKVQKMPNGTYRVRCKYRAKNSFGGYVIANQLFTIDQGKVISVWDYDKVPSETGN